MHCTGMLLYLNLHKSSLISALPESIDKLQNLDLSKCSGVKEIPESWSGVGDRPEAIGSLINDLQYLSNTHN
jgi:hypothetical protein